MKRTQISSGSTFEAQAAYSRALIVGNWIFVSGTTGFDYETMTISEDIIDQTEQCFVNISKVLGEAGSGLEDVVRVHYIIPNATDFPKCFEVLRKYFGSVKPAATMFSANLADERMKIEIEVTALKST